MVASIRIIILGPTAGRVPALSSPVGVAAALTDMLLLLNLAIVATQRGFCDFVYSVNSAFSDKVSNFAIGKKA